MKIHLFFSYIPLLPWFPSYRTKIRAISRCNTFVTDMHEKRKKIGIWTRFTVDSNVRKCCSEKIFPDFSGILKLLNWDMLIYHFPNERWTKWKTNSKNLTWKNMKQKIHIFIPRKKLKDWRTGTMWFLTVPSAASKSDKKHGIWIRKIAIVYRQFWAIIPCLSIALIAVKN